MRNFQLLAVIKQLRSLVHAQIHRLILDPRQPTPVHEVRFGRAVEKTMDESDTAACLADRLLEPEDGLLGSFPGVRERFVLVFSLAVCAPARRERHDDEEGQDGTWD